MTTIYLENPEEVTNEIDWMIKFYKKSTFNI